MKPPSSNNVPRLNQIGKQKKTKKEEKLNNFSQNY